MNTYILVIYLAIGSNSIDTITIPYQYASKDLCNIEASVLKDEIQSGAYKASKDANHGIDTSAIRVSHICINAAQALIDKRKK